MLLTAIIVVYQCLLFSLPTNDEIVHNRGKFWTFCSQSGFSSNFFSITRSFLKLLLLCTFVCTCALRFGALFCFWNQIFFYYTMAKIRRAHLLCVLKRHHTYGVNTFVCSYSLNPNPSHRLATPPALRVSGFPGIFSRDAFAFPSRATVLPLAALR